MGGDCDTFAYHRFVQLLLRISVGPHYRAPISPCQHPRGVRVRPGRGNKQGLQKHPPSDPAQHIASHVIIQFRLCFGRRLCCLTSSFLSIFFFLLFEFSFELSPQASTSSTHHEVSATLGCGPPRDLGIFIQCLGPGFPWHVSDAAFQISRLSTASTESNKKRPTMRQRKPFYNAKRTVGEWGGTRTRNPGFKGRELLNVLDQDQEEDQEKWQSQEIKEIFCHAQL